MSNEERLSGKKLIKVKRRQYKAFVQKQKDEEQLITRFKSQTGFGGRFVSGVVLLVWKNKETIMVAVEDRGQKVRKRRMKDQN